MDISKIYDLLYCFDLSAENTSFFHIAYAIYLAVHQPERLLFVSKWLYPAVAKYYKVTTLQIEYNISFVTYIAWKRKRRLLEELARKFFPQGPKPSEFLQILVAYLTSGLAA